MNDSEICYHDQQVYIPVGCVPPACCPYLPACTVQGGVCCRGVSAARRCLLPGGVCCQGMPAAGGVSAARVVSAQGGVYPSMH